MKNSRAQGDAFRDDVFSLLRMRPGIRFIEREHPVKHQAVDIYYEEITSFGCARVACECKDYGSPLTRSQLEKIWHKYGPLLNEKHVDAVRVITPFPVAVDARRYLETIRFDLKTIDELESTIMDFRTYLLSMKAQFAEGGLDQYYLPSSFETGEDAERWLTNWIHGSIARPVAILATYGMGKSSLAKRIAWLQAERHQTDARERVPILIELKDISAEQDIRGLITKHLAAQHVIQNFHYELFRELNRRGRFLLIFDGFDEMKHTMSSSNVLFNFSELNRLVESDSRVLLLGRPTFFKDAAEQQYALHGIRAENQRRASNAPDYIARDLREFDADQALDLMRALGRYLIKHSATIRGESITPDILEERLTHIRTHSELSMLSQRPVQARMLVELALDPHVEWRTFSRYELYQEFVHLFLAREILKPARQRFSIECRERFQRELAWWMWRTDHAGGFEMRVLPRELFDRYVENRDDAEGVLRDLLTGTLLDSKSQQRYYFRHRSYLEFLVAHHICTEEWSASGMRAVSDTLTTEVSAFIKESAMFETLTPFQTFLNDIEGGLSRQFIELLGASDAYSGRRRHEPDPTMTARDIFVHWHACKSDDLSTEDLIASLVNCFKASINRESRIAAITCLMLHACSISSIKSDENQRLWLSKELRHALAALLLDAVDEMARILSANNQRAGAAIDPEAQSMQLVSGSVKLEASLKGDVQFVLDLKAFLDGASALLEDSIRLGDWSGAVSHGEARLTLRELAQCEPSLWLSRSEGALVHRFFSTFNDPSILVRVRKGRVRPQRAVLGLRRPSNGGERSI